MNSIHLELSLLTDIQPSRPSPINDRPKTKVNIANPGYNAVHQIPVGKADNARFKSLPHSGIDSGKPKPRKPRPPSIKTASAAFKVNSCAYRYLVDGTFPRFGNVRFGDWIIIYW